MLMMGCHFWILLDIVAWHREAKHMFHAEWMTSHVDSHWGHVVPSGMLVVWLIAESGPQGLIGHRRRTVGWWRWLIGWWGCFIGWWGCFIGWCWCIVGWCWSCVSWWRWLVGWRRRVVSRSWGSMLGVNAKDILQTPTIARLWIAFHNNWSRQNRNMVAKITFGLDENGDSGSYRFMPVDLVVLLDNGLVAAMVQHPVANVVDRRGDGHVVAAMCSWRRGSCRHKSLQIKKIFRIWIQYAKYTIWFLYHSKDWRFLHLRYFIRFVKLTSISCQRFFNIRHSAASFC
jgi:hypothetical protein